MFGKMKSGTKRYGLLAATVALTLLVSACSGNGDSTENGAGTTNEGGKGVEITFLNSKGEILEVLEAAALKFHEENPDITVQIIPTPAGQSVFEKTSALYAAGNPTTISMQDSSDVLLFKDRVLDLSGEKWVADVREGAIDSATEDGKIYGFPMTMEGFSLIYNKEIMNQAVGGEFDPDSIVTTADLDELLQKVQDTGVAGSFISWMDWSLGSHLMPIALAAQADDAEGREAFVSQLKAGTAGLGDNEIFNGFIDTFDVLMKYNMDKAAPLASPYEKGAENMAKGEVGVWFMGNWAWPQMKEFDANVDNFAFLPLPLGNTQTSPSKVSVGTTKSLLIDKEKSTPEQQEAAKKFLNWLVYEDSGQDFMVNQASIIPAFQNITLKPQDPLAVSLLDYMDNGQAGAVFGVPSDYGKEVGSSMQKYLSNVIDRAGLAAEIEAYWANKR